MFRKTVSETKTSLKVWKPLKKIISGALNTTEMLESIEEIEFPGNKGSRFGKKFMERTSNCLFSL